MEAMRCLQEVFSARTKEDAFSRLEKVRAFLLSKKKASTAEWLEENIEEALMVLDLPEAHCKK